MKYSDTQLIQNPQRIHDKIKKKNTKQPCSMNTRLIQSFPFPKTAGTVSYYEYL